MICQRSDERCSKQLEAGRQRQPAGEALHLVLHHRLRLAARVRMRGDEQVFDDLLLLRLEQRVVDRNTLELALGAQPDGDQGAAGASLDLDLLELRLHLLQLRLQLGCLLHHSHEIGHVGSQF